MGPTNPARAWALFALATLGLAAVGSDSLARPKAPVPVAVPPPPPPPPPPAGPIDLPDAMVADAAAYDTYMREAVAISPAFQNADMIREGLDRARAYVPASLVRGAVAYGAIAALEDHAFVAALRSAGNTPEHRAQMVDYILANPAYLYGFADSQVAAGLAREAMGPKALRLFANGRAVRKAAYDIQRQGWSKAEVLDLKGRLAAAEAAAAAGMTPEPGPLSEARQSVASPEPLPIIAAPLAPPYTPMVAHALQLAGIAALGEAGDDAADRLAPLTADPNTTACLAEAKLNFHQCLAVARPNYEDAFCMGQHAMIDTGACLAKAAGFEPPPEPRPPAASAPKSPRRRKRQGD